MKSIRVVNLSLSLLLILSAGCAGTGAGGDRTGGAQSGGSGSPALNLATMLTGQWQAEGSGLRLDISTIESTGRTSNLFASATGTTGERTVNERAVLRLEAEGKDINVAVIPKNATVTPLSPEATQVTAAEVRAACSFYLEQSYQGYAGETRGGETCARAIQGATGLWRIVITADTLRLQNDAGQRLELRKVAR